MDYASWQAFSGTLGLIIFVTLFAGVVAYALWPGNRAKFDHAAHIPLADETSDNPNSNGGECRG